MIKKFVELKILKTSDYSDNYLSWINDKDVVKYSENRFKSFSKCVKIKSGFIFLI